MAGRGPVAPPQFRPPPPVPPASALGALKSARPRRREHRTPEEAEQAFIDMLKAHKVCGDWTWEQTLRAVVDDPDYRALKTFAARKDAFHKYISVTREAEDERKRLLDKQRREGFFALLDSLPICEVTRFGKVRHLALGLDQQQHDKGDSAFLAVPTEAERIRMFNAYMDEMAHELKMARRQLRSEQIKTVEKSLDRLKTTARWDDTKPKLLESLGDLLMPILCTNKEERVPMDQPFFYRLAKQANTHDGGKYESKDPEGGLSLLDFMDAFDAAIKMAEKREAEQKQCEKEKMFRQERQNRDAFKQLLKEHSNKITPESTWTEFYPLFKTDQRYLDMLGQPGSTPLELFWDEVEILSEGIYHERKVLESAMRAEDFRFHVDTQLAEVKAFVKFCRESERPSSQNIELIYQQLASKAKRKKEDEEERLARQRRRLLDDFRYALYELDPELDPERSTWENELPRVRRLSEFKDVDDEDACREVFELAVERQRERKSQKRRRREDEPRKRSRSPEHDDISPSTKRPKDPYSDVADEAGHSSGLEEGEMVL
ncbi:U1 snRNP protein [Coemansia sp. RSA 2559]|nr:U1 snRNP protein [Coemansia sp. RSA 2559]KAJ2869727.1 U1 snRNP protein [Coemansia erecta]